MAFTTSRNFSSQVFSLLQKRSNLMKPKTLSGFRVDGSSGQTSRAMTRSMWHMCNSHGSSLDNTVGLGLTVKKVNLPSVGCTCGCRGACIHTEADKQLTEFLKSEIELEKKTKSQEGQPSIQGFSFSHQGAVGELTKESGSELVKVKFNVNHSVEFEENDSDKAVQGEDEVGDGKMRSYPDFTVEITRANQPTIAIQCSYTTDEFSDESGEIEPTSDDLFLIDEMFMYEGKPEDSTYRVGSEVMQGEMYDYLIALLASRGIDNSFAEQLSDVASSFEHSRYINFLETLKSTLS